MVERIKPALSLLALLALIATMGPYAQAAIVDELPNAALTPGAVITTDLATICTAGYARSVRPRGALWRRLKDAAYNEYGLPRGKRSFIDVNGKRHPAYEVDHLVSLELGGSPTDVHNLWPEPIDSAKRKDRIENALHERVCSGREPLAEAQRAIARDWRSALPGTR